jgi:hypothetical protein
MSEKLYKRVGGAFLPTEHTLESVAALTAERNLWRDMCEAAQARLTRVMGEVRREKGLTIRGGGW